MTTEEGFQLKEIPAVLRRRLPIALILAGVVFLGSIVLAALLPNRFDAWTTLLVSPQTVSKKLVEPGVEESDLNQRLHLMTMQILSRGRLSRVIDDLALYPEESKEMTREQVIDLMRDDIRVLPVYPELDGGGRRTTEQEVNTFRLFYSSHSPEKAAAVAQRLANDFIDEHIRERVEVSTGTSEFIESELQRLATEIQQVEERIAAVKNENTGRLPEDLNANQRLLEATLSDLRFAQRDLSIAESDEAFYRQQALTGASASARSSAQPDTPLERRQRLEIALGEARARGFTDKHPDIIILQQEIDSLAKGGLEDEDDSPLTAEQQLANNEAERARLRAESARAEMQRLETQASEIQDRLARAPSVAEQLVALERQHEHLSASFQDFSNKRLEAGVSANMERRQKGEQFKILEAAFPPPEPTSPNRWLILGLGLVMALVAGAGAAVVLEMSDTSLHGARDVQSVFHVPVLAQIPKVMLASDRLKLRRQRVAMGALAGIVTLVVLAGAGAGYWIVNGGQGGQEPAAGTPPPAVGSLAPPAGAQG
jgi:polysaccharide chain length determinant protein (PEP-CTERM system associated)